MKVNKISIGKENTESGWKRSTATKPIINGITYQPYCRIGIDAKGYVFCPNCAASGKTQKRVLENIQSSLFGCDDVHTIYARCKKCGAAYAFSYINLGNGEKTE